MTRGESYQALARMFEYPRERESLLKGLERVAGYCGKEGLEFKAAPFRDFVEGETLETLQEDFVATFDFDPARAPYLGHHLYGDPQKRAEFMIRLKGEFDRTGFSPEGCELPDHLAVVLGFLAHLDGGGGGQAPAEPVPLGASLDGDDLGSFRRRLIGEECLPALRKLRWGEEKGNSHWLTLLATVELLLGADGKEVSA